MLQIRKPEAEELQNLLLLLLKFGDDFKDIFPEADVIKVGQVIQQHYDNGFISNAYINDKLVGSIGAMKTPWWFTPQTKGSISESMVGLTNVGCTKSRSKCHL